MKKALFGILGVSVLVLGILVALLLTQNHNSPTETITAETESTRAAVVYMEVTKEKELPAWALTLKSEITEDFLTVNPYSRPGDRLSEICGIVIHYVGNPGTTAAQNRSYFENLKDTKKTEASSHFIVGLDGEIIQCVPLDEIAYASNSRNADTISIECCHPDETGKFNDATLDSLIRLTAYLCLVYDLDPETDVIRHYDVTGKLCPKYFVDYENAWTLFKSQVKTKMYDR